MSKSMSTLREKHADRLVDLTRSINLLISNVSLIDREMVLSVLLDECQELHDDREEAYGSALARRDMKGDSQ